MMFRLIFYGWMIYNYQKEMIWLAQIIEVHEGLVELDDDGEESGTVFSEEYMNQFDEAYDEEGDWVCCPNCGDQMYFKDSENIFVCLACGYEMERQDFLDYIGADIPGEECRTCSQKYPSCLDCEYGYMNNDDNEF